MMKKISLLLFCLLCLNACSTKMAYGLMGFITKWYIGGYVTLNDDQKSFVSSTMSDFRNWHRETQLPVYIEYVDGVTNRLNSDEITGSWIHAETDRVQVFLDASIAQLKPAIVELMGSFSDKQVEELLENFEKQQAKFQKKRVDISDEKKRKKRVDELTDQTSRFFGKLSSEQKSWAENWSRQLKPYENLTLEQQKTWAKKVEEALRVREDKEKLSRLTDEIVFYRTDDWDQELQERLDHNQDISYELVAKIVNSLSTSQRKKMFSKLEEYKQDFIDLSQEK